MSQQGLGERPVTSSSDHLPVSRNIDLMTVKIRMLTLIRPTAENQRINQDMIMRGGANLSCWTRPNSDQTHVTTEGRSPSSQRVIRLVNSRYRSGLDPDQYTLKEILKLFKLFWASIPNFIAFSIFSRNYRDSR
ncbi:MAG: hypothetical protein ACKO0V_10400 [bacterium]